MKGRRDEVGELLRGSLLHSTVLETRVLRRGGDWAARWGGSGGSCALGWPGRPLARAGHLPFRGRTTTPSNLGGSRACAVLTALPLCHRPEPSTERPGDKGAREGNCFRPGPRRGRVTSTPCSLSSAICSQTPLLRFGKGTSTEAGQASPGSWGLSLCCLGLPSPVAPLRTPNSQIWGFFKSRGTDYPVAGTTGRRTGPPLTSAIPPGGRGHPAFVRRPGLRRSASFLAAAARRGGPRSPPGLLCSPRAPSSPRCAVVWSASL